MALPSPSPRRRLAYGRLIPAVVAVLAVGVAPAVAQGDPGLNGRGAQAPLSSFGDNAKGDQGGFFDSRTAAASRRTLQVKAAALAAAPRPGLRALKAELGVQGTVDLDPLTGTPRTVSKLDGYLAGPSTANPAQIAINYVRTHADAFGLKNADIDGLVLRQEYVDIAGTRHLSFVQKVNGVTVFNNGLKAHIAKDGSLISLDGSPVASLPTGFAAPKLNATTARGAALKDVGGNADAPVAKDSTAQQVVFQTASGPRLAWQVSVRPSKDEHYLHVLDAETGQVLYRKSLINHEADPNQAKASTWNNHPGALRGGDTQPTTLPGVAPGAKNLSGTYAHVYLDLNNNDVADADEEVGPNAAGTFEYGFKNFIKVDGPPCSSHYQCSWNPAVPGSWRTNANQNAVQLSYFLGKFHDHLEGGTVGFTREAGNFDARDGDAVQGEAMDGANTANGLPGGNANNANMDTPVDGTPPRMQMYLFYDDGNFNWLSGNSGDAADIVYHEYTHGLSNRLVVDANGMSTLGPVQAGSMGEAWSDWYAMDLLVKEGSQPDRKNAADLRIGDYVGHGTDGIRTQPIDCKVGVVDAACPGGARSGPGGFTYGDFGKISAGGPEVHADGEIWVETLWDLRCEVGSDVSESLVTRAMELSPSNPSFLDERNAILLADTVVYGGKYRDVIWKTFAARGMGYFAGAIDGDDSAPAEDFSLPPAPGTAQGTVSGTVTDNVTGAPVAGVNVSFGGHSGTIGGNLNAVTAADGTYTISGVTYGPYTKFSAVGGGYDTVAGPKTVNTPSTVANFAMAREWASVGGGGAITGSNGPNFGGGCNQVALIDQSVGSGWVSDASFTGPTTIRSRFVIIKLPAAVNISKLVINPTAACGVGGSAGVGDYKLESSADGVTWTVASTGHFGVPQRGQNVTVPLNAGSAAGVKFLRYTMLSNQLADVGGTCPGAFGGCTYVSTSELSVYGSAS
ncbi:M36 family metallopeptidase [Longispora sp. NPDC051575]|uniref:M36 family metallopeptidase n=1 Tax=Longispora sp. NPDC051575 TaxID=3154943 RepID=UPI0034168FF7